MLLVLIINSLTFSDTDFKTSFFAYVLVNAMSQTYCVYGESRDVLLC